MKKVIVKLVPREKMRNKKGDLYMGENPEAEKHTNFRHTKTEIVRDDLSKRKRKQVEKHEYKEWTKEKEGKSQKTAHRIAVKAEKKPMKGVKFIEKKIKK